MVAPLVVLSLGNKTLVNLVKGKIAHPENGANLFEHSLFGGTQATVSVRGGELNFQEHGDQLAGPGDLAKLSQGIFNIRRRFFALVKQVDGHPPL